MMHRNNDPYRYRPWVVLAASTGINMTMGINYSWSVIKKALVAEWGWTNVEAALPYTAYAVAFAFMLIFAGMMQDRLGPRKVAASGGIIVGTGLIACGFATSPASMTLAYGITGIGNSLCFSTTIPSTMKWFPPERKGLVTGVVVSALGLAAAYFSPIVNWSMNSQGISRTFLILGTVMFLVLIVFTRFMNNPPDDYVPGSTIGAKTNHSAVGTVYDIGWPDIIRSATFRKLWLMYFWATSAGLMIMAHIATIAKTQAGWENGFYLVMTFAVCNAISRLVAGYLSDHFGRLRLMLIIFLLQAVNLMMFAFYGTPALLTLGTATTGLAYGAAFALFPLATADYFGIKNFGGNYGLVFTAWGCAGILGPILSGWVVDMTGRYCIAYIVSALLLFAASLLVVTIRPREKPVDVHL